MFARTDRWTDRGEFCGGVWLLDPGGGENLKHALARSRSRYPDERLLGIRRSVEGKREPIRRQQQRKRSTQRIARVVSHVEADDKRAAHRSLEMDAEK